MKIKQKLTLNPIMTLLILIIVVMLLSGFLALLGVEASYSEINARGDYVNTVESVSSLLSLSGIKYIFSTTVSNFAAFAPLVNLIIVLIGIGIMEKSGFLKTAFTLLTKKAKKTTVTFGLVLVCLVASLAGDLAYVALIPLSALLFIHGRRNPLIGIVTAFAGLTCGSGLSLFATAIDTSLIQLTLEGAFKLDPTYTISLFAFLFIMITALITLCFIITIITERIIAPRFGKYEFGEENEEEQIQEIGKREIRGLIFGLIAGFIYILIFIYCILPIKGLPLAGSFLDPSQTHYVDKLFSFDSFFSNGFVFIITLLFIIWGLFYGLGAKTIKNHNDICSYLGHSLDGIGKPIILIFLAATLISIFKRTNIGTVVVAALSNLITTVSFQGLPLIILLFIIAAIATIVLPSSIAKWSILSGVTIPVLMNAGISPEFSQIIFRFGECFTMGLTPLLAYAVIYLAYMEKYNKNKEPISLFKTIKYQLPYSFATGGILLVIIIVWYLIGVPIGIGGVSIL